MGELKDTAKHFSQAFEGATALADETNRICKAEKIIAVLEQEGVWPNSSLRILDIGCSYGLILQHLSKYLDYCVGIDMEEKILSQSIENVSYLCADGEQLPIATASFDVVICNHVYEHTDNPARLMAEIHRVLKSDGLCYFAGPNKYAILEPHYSLPFLSWLPTTWADNYLKITGKGSRYEVRPKSYQNILRLMQGFEFKNYTREIIADPVRYKAVDILQPGSINQYLALLVLKVCHFFFPMFVLALRKRTEHFS